MITRLAAGALALALLVAPANAQQILEIDAPTVAQHDADIDALLEQHADLEAAMANEMATNSAVFDAIDEAVAGLARVDAEILETLRALTLRVLELEAGTETPPPSEPPPDPPGLTLLDSGPLVATEDGQIIEGLRIRSDGGTALEVNGRVNVTIRNVEIIHSAGRAINVWQAPGTTIENVNVIHTGAPARGPNPDAGRVAVNCYQSPGLTVRRLRVTRSSSGLYLAQCHGARLSFIEGHDIRGPFPRGQLVQWNHSNDSVLEDFSVINPLETSWPEDNVNAYGSNNITLRRGLIDGNNAPSGVGVLSEEHNGAGVGFVVENVDAVRMGNGAFAANRIRDVRMVNVRARDNHCGGVAGREAPRSGAQNWIFWPVGSEKLGIEVHGQYWNACSASHIVWSLAPVNVWDVREADFTPRAPIVLVFPWESP